MICWNTYNLCVKDIAGDSAGSLLVVNLMLNSLDETGDKQCVAYLRSEEKSSLKSQSLQPG